MNHAERRNRLPQAKELTERQASAAQVLGSFIREGTEVSRGVLADAMTDPGTVIGQALLSEGILIGDPAMDKRTQRVFEALGLRIRQERGEPS